MVIELCGYYTSLLTFLLSLVLDFAPNVNNLWTVNRPQPKPFNTFAIPIMINRIKYYGYIEAGANRGAANVLRQNLQNISNGAFNEIGGQYVDATQKQQAEGHKADVHRLEYEITGINERQKELQKWIERVNNGERIKSLVFDPARFFVNLFFLLMLSVYLFQFYVSTTHSALFQSGESSGASGENTLRFIFNAIFNPNVYSEAGGAIWFLIFAPFVFYAFGFAIHSLYESDSKSKWWGVTAVLLITFVLDALLAYKIHQIAQNWQRVTDPDFKATPYYADVNFYIVIFMGFVVYVIWGILLHTLFNEWNKRNPMKEYEKNKKVIYEKEKAISDYKKKINQIEASIPNIVSSYYAGWMSYLNNMPVKDESLITQCNGLMKEFEYLNQNQLN
jgi:hypothetical protein